MVTGVVEKDVALLHLDPVRDVVRLDHRPVVHLLRDVDDHALAAEAIDRDRGNILAARDGVHLRVEMRAGVQRELEQLRDDAVGREALEVRELGRRVADPAGCVNRERVREVDELHPRILIAASRTASTMF